MQKHIKARKIRALKIHTKSTNVSSLWLMMSTFRFLPVFRESYNLILNFKTAPIWLLVGHAELAASNELLFGMRADVSSLRFHSARKRCQPTPAGFSTNAQVTTDGARQICGSWRSRFDSTDAGSGRGRWINGW